MLYFRDPVRKVLGLSTSPYSTSNSGWVTDWIKKLFGEKESNLVIDTNSKPYQRKANYEEVEQHLQKLATTMFPTECNTWRAIDITDLTIKSKVLINCKEHLNHHVPNRVLGSICTLGDVAEYFNSKPQVPAGTLFPDLKTKLSDLPSNLSVQLPDKPKKRPNRIPFQNYDHPDNVTFPNKKERQKKYEKRN